MDFITHAYDVKTTFKLYLITGIIYSIKDQT